MPTSLKERYETRRLLQVRSRVKRLDERVINEERASRLLIEAMNDDDLNKASAIIDKLRSLKGKGLDALDKGISQAEAELNKYTGGGALAKAWTKIKGLAGIDNPLVKTMTMASALERGFRQLPTILKNNVGDPDTLKQNATKSIVDLVPNEEKQRLILRNITKALTPAGVFGTFKKVPYVDMQALATQLLSTNLEKLAPVIRTATAGAQTAEIAPDIRDTATKQGGAETKATNKAAEATPSGQSQPGTPAKDATATSNTTQTGEQTPQPRGGGAPQGDPSAKAYQKVGASLEDAVGSGGDTKSRVMKVLKVLADEGMLKA